MHSKTDRGRTGSDLLATTAPRRRRRTTSRPTHGRLLRAIGGLLIIVAASLAGTTAANAISEQYSSDWNWSDQGTRANCGKSSIGSDGANPAGRTFSWITTDSTDCDATKYTGNVQTVGTLRYLSGSVWVTCATTWTTWGAWSVAITEPATNCGSHDYATLGTFGACSGSTCKHSGPNCSSETPPYSCTALNLFPLSSPVQSY